MNASDYDVWKAKCDSQPWNLERGLQGEHGASAAFANVAREEANKGISGAERSARKRSRTKLVRSIKPAPDFYFTCFAELLAGAAKRGGSFAPDARGYLQLDEPSV